jgi:hypothetical protein
VPGAQAQMDLAQRSQLDVVQIPEVITATNDTRPFGSEHQRGLRVMSDPTRHLILLGSEGQSSH